MATTPAHTPPSDAKPLYHEPLRPQFHFTAAQNWLNDPNGLVFYAGEYHLFFQHNPHGLEWGNMTWGHAVSRDLIHWTQLPNALEPDENGTMFSGSAVVDWSDTAGFRRGGERTLVALYTAAGNTSDASKGRPFTQCLAYSNDRGRTWTKYPGNPVIPALPGAAANEARDPKVVWHEPTKRWVLVLYKAGNTFGLFNSPDLKTWTALHDVEVPGCTECPDLFPIAVEGEPGEPKWVLTVANGKYLVGSFDGGGSSRSRTCGRRTTAATSTRSRPTVTSRTAAEFRSRGCATAAIRICPSTSRWASRSN